ncbi:hypothetical protein G6011_00241 [Alternaria panax]|uniref:Uncharacterized protein n=1 Tax=Alternaria panax TaxID=48097 RepID=A0AAD4IIQ1_9PLEO|nr:hypothetical protein G6011_00241 [Alternaria panax]
MEDLSRQQHVTQKLKNLQDQVYSASQQLTALENKLNSGSKRPSDFTKEQMREARKRIDIAMKKSTRATDLFHLGGRGHLHGTRPMTGEEANNEIEALAHGIAILLEDLDVVITFLP